MRRVPRFVALSFAATIGWFVGMALSFAPAQTILANPAYQSAKFLSVFSMSFVDRYRSGAAKHRVAAG